jgi:hypothetical protein
VLSDVEARIFPKQSAHRWRWGCQPYAPTTLYPPRKIAATHFGYRLSRPQGHSAAGRIRWIERSSDLIGYRNCDLQTCSIVPQPITLPRFSFRYLKILLCRIVQFVLMLFQVLLICLLLTIGGQGYSYFDPLRWAVWFQTGKNANLNFVSFLWRVHNCISVSS